MPEDVTGTLWHVNLFPDYANQKQLYFRQYTASSTLPESGYSYEQYLSDYMEICQPQVLSYDYYPCRGDYGTLSSGYFGNMAAIRGAGGGGEYPVLGVYSDLFVRRKHAGAESGGSLLAGQYCALLRGEGHPVFYRRRSDNGDGTGEQFTGAMFDRDGNRTEIYDYVKNVGVQIAAVDEVLMCSKSQGVILSGSMPWEGESGIPEADLLTAYGALTAVSASHAIVGCFDFDGKAAFYITNNSVTEGDTVALTFNGDVTGYSVQKGVKKDFSGSAVSLTAEAGEASSS